jgi:hypothetical protein
MDMQGTKVTHKTLGSGIVTNNNESYVYVQFEKESKQFSYPGIFRNFLTAEDPEIMSAIKMEIQQHDESIALQQSSTAKTVSKNRQTNHHVLGSNGQRYYLVFQNKTWEAESRGRFLWAPKYNRNGITCFHWETLSHVRVGDVIFHSVGGQLVAISTATSCAYPQKQPRFLSNDELWEDDGWKVDCDYYFIHNPILTSEYREGIRQLRPKERGPFNSKGGGNQGYLFESNYELSKYFFESSLLRNPDLKKQESKFGFI